MTESAVVTDQSLALMSLEQAKLLQQLGFAYKTKYRYFSNPYFAPLEWELNSKPTGYDVDWNDKEHYGMLMIK